MYKSPVFGLADRLSICMVQHDVIHNANHRVCQNHVPWCADLGQGQECSTMGEDARVAREWEDPIIQANCSKPPQDPRYMHACACVRVCVCVSLSVCVCVCSSCLLVSSLRTARSVGTIQHAIGNTHDLDSLHQRKLADSSYTDIRHANENADEH